MTGSARRVAAVALFALLSLPAFAAKTADFAVALDALWDFERPAQSEARFRAELAKWPADSAQGAEVRTQIARTLGLQRKFADAHAMLDTVEAKLQSLPAHVRTRYLLERGRTYNSSGSPQRAVALFTEALALAQSDHDDFYAIDAAHMLGLATPSSERLAWDRRALALAEASSDERARGWRASLYHNAGWSYFDDGDAKTALDYWQKALALRESMGNSQRTRLARWTVARGYRAVGRLADAEAIQKALASELVALGESDGYVYEELAEIAVARGDKNAARAWAAKAHAALKDDPSLSASERQRLARLAAIAADGTPGAATP